MLFTFGPDKQSTVLQLDGPERIRPQVPRTTLSLTGSLASEERPVFIIAHRGYDELNRDRPAHVQPRCRTHIAMSHPSTALPDWAVLDNDGLQLTLTLNPGQVGALLVLVQTTQSHLWLDMETVLNGRDIERQRIQLHDGYRPVLYALANLSRSCWLHVGYLNSPVRTQLAEAMQDWGWERPGLQAHADPSQPDPELVARFSEQLPGLVAELRERGLLAPTPLTLVTSDTEHDLHPE
ncbi:hypothetical protein JNJ66_05390 [Candidatus Saccharibacteria bacterium]|nr:hypothetical protein [Candidatus Saccharibacteria bacterium]